MRLLALFLAAPAAALSSFYHVLDPQPDSHSQYLMSICTPNNTAGYPDLSYPCNVVVAIELECTVGHPNQVMAILRGHKTNGSHHQQQLSPAFQRRCACESQFFDQMRACASCLAAHGGESTPVAFLGAKGIASMSSAYCKPSTAVTLGLEAAWQQWTLGSRKPAKAKSETAMSSFSDPLGSTATAVSLYYTPSVTGSVAWSVLDFASSSAVVGHTKGISNSSERPKVKSVTATNSSSRSAVVTSSTATNGSTSRTESKNGTVSKTSSGGVAQETRATVVVGILGAVAVMVML